MKRNTGAMVQYEIGSGKNACLHWEDPDVDGRIILRWIFRKW